MESTFQMKQLERLNKNLERLQNNLRGKEILKSDLHIHEYESRVPDEVVGQILGIGESWVRPEDVKRTLKHNGVSLLTITNHNNARACWDLKEKGEDILSGGEFTCSFTNMDLRVHVLAYGFTPAQEEKMNHLRKDILSFLYYCREWDIPTVLAHPTYFYSKKLSPEEFNILYLLFDRFEIINGQRTPWNNLLALKWVESFTQDKIIRTEKLHGISRDDFSSLKNKAFTGGSDDHFALYSGGTYTLMDITGYKGKMSQSEKALKAIREGRIAPGGDVGTVGKQAISSLVYLFQIVENMKEPKLMDMLLSKGGIEDKIGAVAVAKAVKELKGNKEFLSYIKTFQDSLNGKRVNPIKRFFVPKDYKFLMKNLNNLSCGYNLNSNDKGIFHRNYLSESSRGFYELLNNRIEGYNENKKSGDKKTSLSSRIKNPLFNLALFDLALIRGSNGLYSKRGFMKDLSKEVDGENVPEEKTLWLSNSIEDYQKNLLKGDSVEFLTCNPELKGKKNVHFLEKGHEIKIDQELLGNLSLFSYSTLHEIFMKNDFTNIIASMDITMGVAAFMLVSSFNVSGSIYISEEWVEFISKIYNSPLLEKDILNRGMELTHKIYNMFDKIYFSKEEDLKRFKELVQEVQQEKLVLIDE